MSNITEDNEEHEEIDNIRALRKAAEAGKQAQNELAEMKRELLFTKAGIDTSSKIGKLLLKTWEGDDLDLLKTEAAELGIGIPTKNISAEIRSEESNQQNFRQNFARGEAAGAAEFEERDPFDEAYELFHQARKEGRSSDDAGLMAIDRVISAAAMGDKRAIFNSSEWADEAQIAGHRFDR